jgi:hypothetical protein
VVIPPIKKKVIPTADAEIEDAKTKFLNVSLTKKRRNIPTIERLATPNKIPESKDGMVGEGDITTP